MINNYMRLNNKQFKNVLQTITLVEGNFGHGFADSKITPISTKASMDNIIGRVLSDQSIPIKSEIVKALENLIDSVTSIQYPPDTKEYAIELGRLIKTNVPSHLQGDVVGLLSRKLNSDIRDAIFKGYSA